MTKYIDGLVMGILIGLMVGLLASIPLHNMSDNATTEAKINLDTVKYVEFNWTQIDLEEITTNKQFYTREELMTVVTRTKQMYEQLKQMGPQEQMLILPETSLRAGQ